MTYTLELCEVDVHEMDERDTLILALSERLYICPRLLTRAAERLSWNNAMIQELIQQLRDNLGVGYAGIKSEE